MDTLTWVLGILVIVVLGGVVMFAIGRRGQASGEGNLGILNIRLSGGRKPQALVEDATSRSGGASATASGDATIRRTEVEGDLTAEAGQDASEDPKG